MNEIFYNFKHESSCRISLNLENLSKIEISNLKKLTLYQGRNLKLPSWEINALLSIGGNDRISLEHVIKILYDYAGLQDCISRDFTDFMVIYRDISMKLMQNDVDYISSCFARQAIKLMSLFTSLCNWRRLQACPRPYYIYHSDNDDNSSSSNNDNNNKNIGNNNSNIKISLQSILKRCAEDLFQLVNSLDINLRDHQVLLHDACISTASYLNTSNMFVFLDLDNNYSNNHHKDESLRTVVNQLVDTINRIIAMENATEKVHKAYASVLEEVDPYSSFPVMRLPYGSKAAAPPMDDLAWFEDAIHDYKTCAEVLDYYKKSLMSMDNRGGIDEVRIDGESYFEAGSRARSKSVSTNIVNYKSSSPPPPILEKRKSFSFDDTSGNSYSNANGHININGFSNHQAPQMFDEITKDLDRDNLDELGDGLNGMNGLDHYLEDIGVVDVLEAVKQQEEREEDLVRPNHKSSSKDSNRKDHDDIWRPKPRSRSPTAGKVPRRKGSTSPSTIHHHIPDKDKVKDSKNREQSQKRNDQTSSIIKSKKNSTMNKKGKKQKDKQKDAANTDTADGGKTGIKEESFRKAGGASASGTSDNTIRRKRFSDGSISNSTISHTVDFDVEHNYELPSPNPARIRSPGARPLSNRVISNTGTPITTERIMINSSSNSSISPGRIRSSGFTRNMTDSNVATNINNRQKADGSRRFSSKPMEVLSTFNSLTSPNTRSEARLESQVVYIALRAMQVDGSTIVEAAAFKIQIWWKLTWPKFQLRKRLANKEICKSIVDDLVLDVMHHQHKRLKRQALLLRLGAALRIQRCFRDWKIKILSNVRLIQQTWAKFQLRKRFNRILMYTRSGVRLYRFIRARNKLRNRKSGYGCKKFLQVYFHLIGAKVQRVTNKNKPGAFRRSSVAGISAYGDSSSPIKRSMIHHLNTAAVIAIQKHVRRFLLQLKFCTLINKMKMSIYLGKCLDHLVVRHKIIKGLKCRRASKKIQAMCRGYLVRGRIFRQISSSMVILAAWRRYKSSSNLRSSLRRIERPLVITLKKVTGIKAASMMAGNISIKISVWWHPLLHIVTASDFTTIMKNKHPQMVYTTSEFECISEEVYNNSADKKIVRKSSGKWGKKSQTILKRASMIGERISKKFNFPQFRGGDGNMVKPNLTSKEFVCDFNNFQFVIPGCHGNSVLKFEFSSDERNVGTVTTFLGNRGQLMFWREEIEVPLQVIEARRAVIMRSSNGQRRGSSSNRNNDADSKKKQDRPKFEFSLDSGLPQMNRSQWCFVSIEGKGPARKAFRKGVFSVAHFFENWERMFICTEGSRLFFFKSKNSIAPEYSFYVNTIIKVRKEFATSVVSRMRGSDDLHNIIINTNTDDEIGLRFPDQKSRELWRIMLEHFVVPIVKRDRGIVLPRLGQLSRQFSSKLSLK